MQRVHALKHEMIEKTVKSAKNVLKTANNSILGFFSSTKKIDYDNQE